MRTTRDIIIIKKTNKLPHTNSAISYQMIIPSEEKKKINDLKTKKYTDILEIIVDWPLFICFD